MKIVKIVNTILVIM